MKITKLVNQEGEEVDKAPHPLEELTMTGDKNLPAFSILRRRAKR